MLTHLQRQKTNAGFVNHTLNPLIPKHMTKDKPKDKSTHKIQAFVRLLLLFLAMQMYFTLCL